MYQAKKSGQNKLLAIISAALLMALAVFILTLAVKVGSDLVNVLQPIPVEAAPEESTAQPTSIPVTPTATPVEDTPVPLTTTPQPTSTPVTTATLMPTQVIQARYAPTALQAVIEQEDFSQKITHSPEIIFGLISTQL